MYKRVKYKFVKEVSLTLTTDFFKKEAIYSQALHSFTCKEGRF